MNRSILDESEGGLEKHENEAINVVKDKEEHAKAESESESDSELDNPLNPLLHKEQLSYSTSKFNDLCINSKKVQNIFFSFQNRQRNGP